MRIVINDANILIDLVHLDFTEVFFQVENLELKTTDFVFEELLEEQKIIVNRFVAEGRLEILESVEDDLIEIVNIKSQTTGLSFEDCSVWYFAQKTNGILLTGDGKLRRQSIQSGIEVKGILYIFDELLNQGLITFEFALLKINQLYELNDRLPIEAKDERIESWSRQQHIG
jgi:predicted nucleic acid-binding protein